MNNNSEMLLEIVNSRFCQIRNFEAEVESIFRTFAYPQNTEIVDDILGQFQNQFNLPAMEFLQLLIQDRTEINQRLTNNKMLSFINRLDKKYGYLLKKNFMSKNKPFMFVGLDVNVEQKSSVHTLRIKRADGQKLECDVTADLLLSTATALIGGLNLALNNGIFNLNSAIIDNYAVVTKELNNTLERITKK